MATQPDTPVMTVLEAQVTPERWAELETLYRESARRLPPRMLHAYLVQDSAQPTR